MKNYDLAIIGSGPGGYVAGLYASRFNMKVCVIEKGLVGGACLNKGCIPTKSILHSASLLSSIKNSSIFGIETGESHVNFAKVASRKDEVVSRLRTGVETLLKANKIDLLRGQAKIISKNTIDVEGAGSIEAKSIIIGTGSAVMRILGIAIDEKDVLSSDGILELKELPGTIAIIGGGVIGCEFASLFSAFGTKVTIVEFTDRLLPGLSREVSKKMEQIFKRRGINIILSSKAEGIMKAAAMKVAVSGGKTIEAEKVLVAVGRVSYTEGLGDLGALGIKTDRGRIVVDEYLNTGSGNIYAIGDCVSGPLLAHKASYDGMLACDNIMGKRRKTDYSNIPTCVWTDPEIASIGLTEEEAKISSSDIKIAKFPYLASGKAYLLAKSEGFAKIIGDQNGRILGVEIFGEGACDLIGEAALARTCGINVKDWQNVVHAHPTLSEILQEAAHIFCGKGIHTI